MAKYKFTPAPLRIGNAAKRDTRTQFGAIPFRRKKSGVEVLLISTRNTGRWIVPKGWPMDGQTPAGAAQQEAWEEAGVRGRIHHDCVGLYSYTKWLDETVSLPCIVALFALEVRKVDDHYPEMKARKRRWMSCKKAASRVDEPELRTILRNFNPKHLRKA